MLNYISVMIADEYKSISEIKKAQTLYSKSLSMYETECWLVLSQDIVTKLSELDADETGNAEVDEVGSVPN